MGPGDDPLVGERWVCHRAVEPVFPPILPLILGRPWWVLGGLAPGTPTERYHAVRRDKVGHALRARHGDASDLRHVVDANNSAEPEKPQDHTAHSKMDKRTKAPGAKCATSSLKNPNTCFSKPAEERHKPVSNYAVKATTQPSPWQPRVSLPGSSIISMAEILPLWNRRTTRPWLARERLR